MGRMSRNKGKRGEREAAKELSRILGIEARRGIQFQGGPDSPDVITELSDWLHIEVKRSERLAVYEALEQAEDDANGKVPLVLHRRNCKPWIAITYLDQLPKLSSRKSES